MKSRRFCSFLSAICLVSALGFGALAGCGAASDVRVMSFNIRYGTAADGPNHWRLRRELVFETIEAGQLDFLGLQEALEFQIDEIGARLASHRVLYRTRAEKEGEGEACPIFYRADRWRLHPDESGTFWLSETPRVPGSKSWDSSLPRIATWGRFENTTTAEVIVVYNVHFDHRGEMARAESARLLMEHIEERARDLPVVVLGDFNAGEESPPVLRITAPGPSRARLVDSWRVIHPTALDAGTFNGWAGLTDGAKIDYVFVRPDAVVVEAEIVRRVVDGRHPSDHDPVTATLRLGGSDD